MNKRRKLKRQFGKKYRYKKFMTAFEVKKLLESQMDKKSGKALCFTDNRLRENPCCTFSDTERNSSRL